MADGSANGYLNLLPLAGCFRLLGQNQFQYAILELGLRLVLVHARENRDHSMKFAVDALHQVVVVLLFLVLFLATAADRIGNGNAVRLHSSFERPFDPCDM